jgi:hypothetical protein
MYIYIFMSICIYSLYTGADVCVCVCVSVCVCSRARAWLEGCLEGVCVFSSGCARAGARNRMEKKNYNIYFADFTRIYIYMYIYTYVYIYIYIIYNINNI